MDAGDMEWMPSAMFHFFSKVVTHTWFLFLAAWIALAVYLHGIAPKWKAVAQAGQFDALPADSPSKLARDLYRKAFPEELTNSSVVIVLVRPDKELTDADRLFAERDLRLGLLKVADSEGGLAIADKEEQRRVILRPELAKEPVGPVRKSYIARIRNFYDPGSGPLLTSADKRATLVIAEMTHDLLAKEGWPTVAKIEGMVNGLREEKKIPPGLTVEVTGSAIIGRDIRETELASVEEVEKSTVVLVIILLLVIYRAPLLALIPMLTVFLAVVISISLLAMMAERGWITVSETTKMYIIVVAYGAGVDYCLFQISRYREELEAGNTNAHSVFRALHKTGHALAASAATVACGIATLAFAEFGRYHQAGICIPFSLVVVLIATLTFTPSMLRLTRSAAFWPQRLHIEGDTKARRRSWDRLMAHGIWQWMGRAVVAAPGFIWLVSVAVLVPFAFIAYSIYNQWDYGLTSESRDSASENGTRLVHRYFSAGVTGPIVVVLRNEAIDLGSPAAVTAMGVLSERIERNMQQLHIQDIRNVDRPHGISPATARYRNTLAQESVNRPELQRILQQRAIAHYVSNTGVFSRHVARMDLVFEQDPLSRQSIADLARIAAFIRSELPPELEGTEVGFCGSTASLRDLADVTTRDLVRIEWLVPLVVYFILVMLLQRPVISLYLIVSVIFSYLATLGVAHVFFEWLDPIHYTCLDWKVPIFLFTILVAVGEDYNIFLMTRVQEEQEKHGLIEGVRIALVSTGGIISSCGVIMAGTFAALWVGKLVEMKQMGFALAFGVLLDTLVVRPLLVPAFMILLYRLRNSVFGEQKPNKPVNDIS